MNRRNALKNLSILTMASMTKVGEAKSLTENFSRNQGRAAPAYDQVQELAPGVFFRKGKLRYFQDGNFAEAECNNGWVVFDDFVVLIDANFPDQARIILSEIQKTTTKPVRYVLNTHHHGDHLYGNRFWSEQGAAIIAHTGVLSALRKYETGYYSNIPGRWESARAKRTGLKNYPLLPPALLFDDKLVIEDKNRRLELLHLGAGHTVGDAIAWLPAQKILFTGDSCLNGPYNLFMDAESASWIQTLEKMQRLQAVTVVPGHGELGNSETVKNQQDYFKTLHEWVEPQKHAGLSFDAIQKKLPELRASIQSNESIKKYLIPEPVVIPTFSLEAQTKKIFEQII